MGRYVEEQVRDILEAVTANDHRRAQDIAARDDRIDRIYHRVYDDMVETMRAQSEWVYAGTNLIFIAHNLERIADRVTNIAEDVVFLATGRLTELG
jgi:phosphate transport system protein